MPPFATDLFSEEVTHIYIPEKFHGGKRLLLQFVFVYDLGATRHQQLTKEEPSKLPRCLSTYQVNTQHIVPFGAVFQFQSC